MPPPNVPVFPVSPELFSLPTITLMVTLIFLAQASAIAFSAVVVKAYHGVWVAFFATLCLALAFGVNMLLPQTPGQQSRVGGIISNMFSVAGHFLYYLALCRFTQTFPRRLSIYAAYGGIALMLFLPTLPPPPVIPITVVSNAAAFVLTISASVTLYQSDNSRFRLAAILTAIPLFVYGLFALMRVVIGLANPRAVLPGQDLSNVINVLALFVLSFLWTAGFILMISQRLQSDLSDLAMNDALTRVRNRRAMQNLLDFEMSRVDSEVREFSIVLLDIDHFKRFNDTYGHDVGDIVLQWIASTLRENVRVQDEVARWGGEEFLILLPETDLTEAMEIAERLRYLVETSGLETPTDIFKVTFSAGVAESRYYESVDLLCKAADDALYLAKQTRNSVMSQEALISINIPAAGTKPVSEAFQFHKRD